VSIVDSAAFKNLLAYLEPSYHVPCRQTMTKHLEQKQDEVKVRNLTYYMQKVLPIALTMTKYFDIDIDYRNSTSKYQIAVPQ